MNPIKVTLLSAGGASYNYEASVIPQEGQTLNFSQFAPGVMGTVSTVNWVHTNEVMITLK